MDEINTLSRLAGRRTPAEHGLDAARVTPGMQEVMLEMILLEVEEMDPPPAPKAEDLALLLASGNPRVRELAIRLAGRLG
jgi:hypothetical protein